MECSFGFGSLFRPRFLRLYNNKHFNNQQQHSLAHTQYAFLSSFNRPTSSSSSPNSGPPPPSQPPGNSEFHLNSGKAIDTLRSELPYYFEHGLIDHSIYDKDILLSEPQHYRFYVRGHSWYKRFFGYARNVLNWYFSDLTLNVLSVSRPVENQFIVRWQIEGLPNTSIFRQNIRSYLSRSKLFGTAFKRSKYDDDDEGMVEKTRYEGIFVYKFNSRGLIAEHSIENIMPIPKTFVPLHAISWWQRGGKLDLELNSSSKLP